MHFTRFTIFIVLALSLRALTATRGHFRAFVATWSCTRGCCLSFIAGLDRVMLPSIWISVALVVSIPLVVAPPVVFLVSSVVSRVYRGTWSPDLVSSSKHIIVKPPEVCREHCSECCRAEDQRERLHGVTRTAHYSPLSRRAESRDWDEFYGDTKISSSGCQIFCRHL